MGKLVQKINWHLINPSLPSIDIYMYGNASTEANQKMQKPLEKLYEYENQPDMREMVREYISELDMEIDRVEGEILNTDDKGYEKWMMSRIETLAQVRNDLIGRLDEVIV